MIKNSQISFIRCPMGGHCFNPLCIFGCINSNKRIKKVALFITFLLSLFTVPATAQLGCLSTEITAAITNSDSLKLKEYFVTSEYIYILTEDNSAIFFNLEYGMCIQLTALIQKCSNDLVKITQLFILCNSGEWSSSMSVEQPSQIALYKIKFRNL